jgi:hypothetical protein
MIGEKMMTDNKQRDRDTGQDGATIEQCGGQTDDRAGEPRPTGRQDTDDRHYAVDDDRSSRRHGKRDSRRST